MDLSKLDYCHFDYQVAGGSSPLAMHGYMYVNCYPANLDFEAMEDGLEDVVVTLTGTDSLPRMVDPTPSARFDGYYEFVGLKPGAYEVVAANSQASVSVAASPCSAGGSTATDASAIDSIELREGQPSANGDLGVQPTARCGEATPAFCRARRVLARGRDHHRWRDL